MPGSATDRSPIDLPVVSRTASRRQFLRGSAQVLTLLAVGGYLVGCEVDDETDIEVRIPSNMAAYADNVPPPPEEIDRERLGFFTEHEATTIEAFTARLIPGTPEDPGAREAGVLTYMDVMLATVEGFWRPTYIEPPFAETYSGDTPPGESGSDVIYVSEDEIDRYGFQSQLTPREIYRRGLESLDALSQERLGARFVDLDEDQQDEIVTALADDEAPTFDEPSAELFFETLRRDTAHGMFADPSYGGNRDMVGWRLIGYPGAQRAYTPTDMRTEAEPRPPQSMAMLHAFNAGTAPNEGVILPVSDDDPQNQRVREGGHGEHRHGPDGRGGEEDR